MNCKEFIELFNKIGGILYCDYNKNKAYVVNTNLKCNITSNDYDDFTNWKKSYSNEEHRKYLLDKGKEYAINFLESFENNNNDNDNEKISDNDIYIDKE